MGGRAIRDGEEPTPPRSSIAGWRMWRKGSSVAGDVAAAPRTAAPKVPAQGESSAKAPAPVSAPVKSGADVELPLRSARPGTAASTLLQGFAVPGAALP